MSALLAFTSAALAFCAAACARNPLAAATESLSFELYGGLILLLLAAGCLLLRRYIMTKGVKLFEQLQA